MQASKVLTLLASRPGDTVTREELKRHLWAADTFVDFDRSLNFCVAAVRTALRDDARSPRFIETLPRRGYRFIAETVIVDPVAPRSDASATVRSSALHQAVQWSFGLAAVLLVLVQQPAPAQAHSRATARPDARAAFTQALEAHSADAASLRRSAASLKRATELDPRFAEAYFALADVYLKLALKRELPQAAAFAEAEAAARRAIALEDVAETREVLATLRLVAAWDWDGARRELVRAVELAPRWDIGLARYARVLSARSEDALAIQTINQAETLSPTCDLILYDAGVIYWHAGRFVEADEKLRRSIDMGPPRSMTLDQWRAEVQFSRLRLAAARGDWRGAHEAASAILEANGQPETVRRRFGQQPPRSAVAAFLRRSVDLTKAAAANQDVSPMRLATLFALLDDRDAAIAWLEAAASQHDPDLPLALRDPEFVRLHDVPRFKVLERRIRGGVRVEGTD
jgi:DNA-binding winged helix-turn-helix (wHTH) protein/tetratricopeptide (TPR) repeat protein